MVAANMAPGRDGRWTALHARPVYEQAKAAGSVYQAHLRAAVRERVGWAVWGPERQGMAELEAVPAGVVEEFSQRRHQIQARAAELAAAGITVGAEGYPRAALATREAKRAVSDPDWRQAIRARAAEHGLGETELAALMDLPAAEPAAAVADAVLAAGLFGPHGVTARQNTFTEADVVAAAAAAQAQGASVDRVLAVAGRMLERPEVVAICGGERGRYTTRELLEAHCTPAPR